ncbi:triggering receptor expressed on myeloid cells 2-like isoform X1 [Bufo gargarizans]|uniref:triggering receptor expressed on myeloid cells 2-like isoform X1 n=1 Tax=Bufo gargarizans TaxID=30331 RepID=UPI001CF18CBB|nr:triggering receptor expressed on myeloid cells 2-like isoform X1 [Bufo gargarizans]
MDKCFSLSFTVILLGTLGWCLAKDITVYSGQLGETLNIVCPYQQRADRWKKKVWCKEDEDGFCQSVVSVHSYWINIAKRTNGSADISDNYQKGIIIINMTNLQKSDSGVYQCRTVTFGDVSTLQRIQVQVLEDQQKESVSELENTQYSISGLPSETQIPVMLVVIGSSLISCKLLLLGFLYIWWKRHEDIYSTSVDQEPFTMPLSAGHSDVEYSLPTAREEDDDSPQYINYIQMGYLNQAHYQQ